MFLRELPELTVNELSSRLYVQSEESSVVLHTSEAEVDLVEDEVIRLGDDVEVPVRSEFGLKSLAKWLGIPYKFLDRQDREIKQYLVSTLMGRKEDEARFAYSANYGLVDVRKPNIEVIDPKNYTDIAGRVIDPTAQVVDFLVDEDYLQFDVIVPDDYDYGWGGDPNEGDITAGGLRFGQDRKANLAPWVQPFMYRLACTNGYETFDPGLKVDARGSTVDDVLMMLEEQARRAFGRIESEIASFYELRDEPVRDPSQAILRIGEEGGLPNRTVVSLIERVPEFMDPDETATQFDVVNLITNAANDPSIHNRPKIRRRLEQAGGSQVSEHIARCRMCQHRLHHN